MPGIYLYTGNRLEILAEKLADLFRSDPLPPFDNETVLLQSRGMERWLTLAIADRSKIWANYYCPFPNTFIRNIYRLLIPELSETSSYDLKFITWYLMDIIPGLLGDPGFGKVRGYLASDDGRKLFQLASEMADLFDQYTIFRPEMLLEWEAGRNTHPEEHQWQSILWQHLIERLGENRLELHRGRLLAFFEKKIGDAHFDNTILPARISVFGISSLPPYHMKILAGLARHLDLHIFLMNPCMEFWSDIVADRDIVRFSRTTGTAENLLHMEHGNPLLSSMGHLGRDFLNMIQEFECLETEYFQDPGSEYLLACIQQDILYLWGHHELSSGTDSPKRVVGSNDRSIVFQSCHSPMREVEVLHDQLLDIIDKDAGNDLITPRDILVMAPDIDDYAPLIRAVFDAGGAPNMKLPYRIADQTITRTSTYVEAFRTILELAKSRFTSIDVLGLLKNEPVRKRFSITENEFSILERWITQTGIRWGIDAHHKKDIELPDFMENTWRAGLDRLFLGYAMKGASKILFENILPYDHMEGNDTDVLGKFAEYAEALFELPDRLLHNHTLSEWMEILLDIQEMFLLAEDSTESDSRLLHQAILELQEIADTTSFHAKVSLDVIQTCLFGLLEQRHAAMAGGTDFLTGTITFCSMLPMRSIPFKVICLLGMNDGYYPRSGQRRSFDLITLEPRRGDRSRRHDDRYLFLETILSARNILSISFIGQSVRDTTIIPPSVLVSELMDYISQGYILADQDFSSTDITGHLTTCHKLQPFHPDYFSNDTKTGPEKLFSYSDDNCQGASALMASPQQANADIAAPLAAPPEIYKQITLPELIGFFTQPVKYFLLKRIGIAPFEKIRVLDTSEPFTVNGLARYELENDILSWQMAGQHDLRELYLIKKADGTLPHGRLGEIFFNRKVSEVKSFKKSLDRLFAGNQFTPRNITLQLQDYSISGRLDNLTDGGMVLFRYASIKPKDIVRGWLSHLVLNCIGLAPEPDSARTTYLAGINRICKFAPTPESPVYLEQLLDLYWQGLTEPLPFFPETSFDFSHGVYQGRSRQDALSRARNKWEGDTYVTKGESNDPYYSLGCRNINLSESGFMDLAETIFMPIFQHMKEYSG